MEDRRVLRGVGLVTQMRAQIDALEVVVIRGAEGEAVISGLGGRGEVELDDAVLKVRAIQPRGAGIEQQRTATEETLALRLLGRDVPMLPRRVGNGRERDGAQDDRGER